MQENQQYLLSSPQREIWFDQMLHPNVPLYNIGASVEINIAVDYELFVLAVQHVAAGHDAMRTILQPGPSASELPLQTFLDEMTVPVPLLDLSAEDDPEQAAATWMQAQFTKHFSLHDQPLCRFALLKVRENHCKFFSVYHHLITDGWGVALFNKRLGMIYSALLKEGAAPFRSEWLFPSYCDFIDNDLAYAQSPRHSKDLRYWADKYRSLPEPLFRPKQQRAATGFIPSERQVLWLERSFYNRMAAFAKEAGSTPFHVMLGALYVYFVRTLRRDELAVGLPILNRSGAAFKETIGLFINMIPARFSFGADLSFRELLLAIGRTLKADYRHQRLPIGDLCREIGLHSAGQRNLIDLQFNYAKHDHETESGIFQGKTITLTNDSKQSPLIISVWEFHDHADVQVDFVYNLAWLDAEEVRRVKEGFVRILEQALADADLLVSAISLVSREEQVQLAAWNQSKAVPAAPATLAALFEAQAEKHADCPAVVCEGRQLSYAELNRKANQLAHCLISLGVGPEILVGICVERSLDMVIGLLAILKAGGAYVPLDPDSPQERLRFLLEDSGVKALLTQSSLLETLPEHSAATLCMDSGQARLAAFPSQNPLVEIWPDNLAYVIYTSGSTGKPKGCLVTHQNVSRLFAATEELYQFTADDVWTLFHSYAFDFSVWEIWGALLYGGKLVVVPYLTSRDPEAFYQLLIDQRVTVLNQTPSAFRQLIKVDSQPDKLALRYVIFGGEALEHAALRPWFAKHGCSRPQLVNMYGITETTVHVTCRPLTGCEEGGSNIGRPLADLQIWLLDAQQQPLPIGIAGEMFVGGAGVSRGYLNRPELTASRFIETELFGQKRRLYKTGDLARQLPDGSLEYLGRIDQQVKIRGFRIEPGEVESLLARHEAVREAVVMPFGRGDNARLLAYATLAAPLADAERSLRAWLAERLPDYMLPASFMIMDSFPLTVNGKIDRKALPEPDAAARTGFVAPQTGAEILIAKIWQKILGVERVGIHDDFFAIGGNSLNGIRFINELNVTTQEIFHIYDLFAAPTVSKFVDGIRSHYPNLMARLDGAASSANSAAALRQDKVKAEDLAELERLIEKPRFKTGSRAKKNPPAVFILAPPRSGTTLLRVMLGGHPGLFAPPELELLGFADLRERAARCAEHDAFWLQGTVRALMELHGCAVEQAWQMMTDYENNNLDVQSFYQVLQAAAKDRLLVDKTPFYSVDAAILQQAEEYFDNALYIHLRRHPFGMIRSFEKSRMERILSGHPYSSALTGLAESGSSIKLAEMLWLHCNLNILTFLQDIPAERQHCLKFEDLVSQPQPTLARLCDFLKLPLHQDMLKPYQGSKQRMTDGIHAEGKMLGDIKFHAHEKIEAKVAENWRTDYKEDFLSDATWSLAERLGYQRELKLLTIPRLREKQPLQLSFAQQRLWFLSQLEGRTATYNVPVALRLEGGLDVQALRSSFVALIERHESLRVCFPAINGAATAQRTAVYDPLTVVELPIFAAAAERQKWLDNWLDKEVHRSFDLETGPLLRLHLLKIGPEEHLLLLNMHHIVSDGWSMGVLIREWSQLYSAAVQQQELRLPELSIQYSDYAAWQKNWLEQGVLAAQLAYWREKLAGMPELLELPTDFPRPPMLRHQGRRLKSRIRADVTRKIKLISQEQGATLFMTLLAAFNVLLHRCSRQSDLAVGSPVANRSHHQTEGLIGFFVNTLVLRTQIDSSQSFLDLLRQVRQTALEAYSHQDVPFEYLVEQLNPVRSMSHAPLFQVMFLLIQSVEEPQLNGLNMSLLEPDYKVAKFDLTLTAAEQNGELVCAWEYDTDLFRAETIAALAEHFAVLLEGICASPEQPVSRLPLLTAAEMQRFSTQQRAIYPAEQTVIAQFEAQAAARPDNVAAVCAGQQLTYKELNRQANQLARHLIQLGVRPESLVGICVDRSLDMLVGLIGILKAGGAYLPLDPDYPQERLRFMLEDAAVRVLLTQTCLLERLPLTEDIRTVVLDRDWQAIAAHSADNLALQSRPDNLAYVIYTSGSTGKPKGCLVTHANISRLFTATEYWYHFNEQDVWTLFHSYAFDFSVWEIWGALLYGGRLIVVPYLTSRDPEAFYQLLIEQRVTVLNQTPSAFRQLISVDNQPDKLALRCVIFGGEALDCAMLERWFVRHDPAQPQLINMYGITETTVHVTYCPLTGCQQDGGGIGIPIPDLHVWILDSCQQPVPVGVPGEMHVSGGGVTRGYLNHPELTAARFIEIELFGHKQRLYKTGDLARWRADGSLEYLGRIDQQVKLRGFRIELGEIEAALMQHGAVREAVALLDDKDGAARLLAYVVPTEDAPAELIEMLRSQLRSRLPEYMVPAGFHLLDALPLTSNGKLDRHALGDLSVDAAEQRSRIAPRTDEERRMTEIWAEVLRLRPEQIGVHDNFFDLGGHSLLATQLVSRIRTAFAAELSLRQLFALPTVAELARLLTTAAQEIDAAAEMEEGEL